MLYTKGVDQIIIKGDVYTWYKRSLNLLSLPGFILDIWRSYQNDDFLELNQIGLVGMRQGFFQSLLYLCYRIFFSFECMKTL